MQPHEQPQEQKKITIYKRINMPTETCKQIKTSIQPHNQTCMSAKILRYTHIRINKVQTDPNKQTKTSNNTQKAKKVANKYTSIRIQTRKQTHQHGVA